MDMQKKILVALVSSAVLAGCSSSDNDENFAVVAPDGVTIDASDYTDYAYFNLESGEVVELTSEQAAASTEWHVGFRRNTLILNGGVSGPGNVEGALGVSQDDFYGGDEPDVNAFTSADADAEAEHLLAEIDPSSLTFQADEYLPAIQATEDTVGTTTDMGWYSYNFATHATTLNADTHWFLRSNTGTSFARFSATEFDSNETSLDVTFEFDVQAEGTTTLVEDAATFNASVLKAGGEDCFDFDSNSDVACDSADWDLKLEISGYSWTLWTNGGVSGDGSGGAYGPFTAEEAAEYTSATLTDTGYDFSNHYSSDSSAGVFVDNPWYAYNLQGDHKLWPNYRAYVIDTDTSDDEAAVYKFQITSYYDAIGTSGHPTIRFVEN